MGLNTVASVIECTEENFSINLKRVLICLVENQPVLRPIALIRRTTATEIKTTPCGETVFGG